MTRSLLDGILTGTRYGVTLYNKGAIYRVRLYLRSTQRTLYFAHSPVELGADEALREVVRIAHRENWPFAPDVLAACGLEARAA